MNNNKFFISTVHISSTNYSDTIGKIELKKKNYKLFNTVLHI